MWASLLCLRAGTSAPWALRYVESLLQLASSGALRVDCPMKDITAAKVAMLKVLKPLPLRWTDPVRSPGSLPKLERVILTVRFPVSALSQLQRQAATAHFCRLAQDKDTLIPYSPLPLRPC